MTKLIFVIGATATGKTHFINEHFSNGEYELLNVFDYQNRVYDEAGLKKFTTFSIQQTLLMRANLMILDDMIKLLSEGKSVVVEHTLFRAKRRIAYTDEVKKLGNVSIDVYVMQPSKEQWESNIGKRGLEAEARGIMRDAEIIEFPNPAEGFDNIYEVVGNEIKLRMETPAPEIIEPAREEIRRETQAFLKKEKEAQDKNELLESMKHRPFWHYCEVCGKKELLTAEEAHKQGWDYPPTIGKFGFLSPRTCGDCKLTDTLFWKITTGGMHVVVEDALSPSEAITWNRIKNEPYSLLDKE